MLEKLNWDTVPVEEVTPSMHRQITADLNGDGRLDIMESNSDEVNSYYFNLKK